jgi:hypothetical protein
MSQMCVWLIEKKTQTCEHGESGRFMCATGERGCWLKIFASSSADNKWHILAFTFINGFIAGATHNNEHQIRKEKQKEKR